MTEQITVQPIGNFKINPIYTEEGMDVGQPLTPNPSSPNIPVIS